MNARFAVLPFVAAMIAAACSSAPDASAIADDAGPDSDSADANATDAFTVDAAVADAIADGDADAAPVSLSCTSTFTDIGAGHGAIGTPTLLVDRANAKLLVVTADGASLYRCDLDGKIARPPIFLRPITSSLPAAMRRR